MGESDDFRHWRHEDLVELILNLEIRIQETREQLNEVRRDRNQVHRKLQVDSDPALLWAREEIKRQYADIAEFEVKAREIQAHLDAALEERDHYLRESHISAERLSAIRHILENG